MVVTNITTKIFFKLSKYTHGLRRVDSDAKVTLMCGTWFECQLVCLNFCL